MSKLIAAAALSICVGLASAPVRAQVATPGPDVEPRNHLSPTDESEATPRVPPITHPRPMERTRIGEPAEPAPNRVAPPERASQARTGPPNTAKARRIAPQRKGSAPRRVVRTPSEDDTSLSSIFTQPRYDTRAPPDTLAPRGGPPRATYNYAPLPSAVIDGAPCPTRSRTALGELFACTR